MSGPVARAKVSVSLTPTQRADEAAAAVLLALVQTVREDFAGALAGEDPEYLHQLRIAIRRSRTVLRQLAAVFPAPVRPGFKAELRWLQRVTGPARDLDVHLEELVADDAAAELAPLREVLAERRGKARAAMASALRSRRTAELLEDWSALLRELPGLPEDDRPWASLPVHEAVGRRIRRLYRRVCKMGEAIGGSSPPGEYHELRKKGKELRYLLELFGPPVFDARAVEELVGSLKELQDVLGRHQDREVQVALLRSASGEVAARPGGSEAAAQIEALVERLLRDQAEARREFAQRFAALAAAERRRLVEETFR